jgi:hypothetical protein
MTRTIGLSALVVALLLAWQSYAVWSMLQTCSAKARAIIAAADPLDREPPETLKSVVERNVALDDLLSHLATVLLDRYSCRADTTARGTEWLIDQPSLTWHLRTTFGKTEAIALFAATADMGKGQVGMNSGAQRIYKRSVTELDETELECLVRRPFGHPLHVPVSAPVPPIWVCPGETTGIRSR